MGIETDADRAVFVDADEHGVEVTYTTQAMAVSVFNAIFENAYEAVEAGEFAALGSRAPQITVPTSYLPAGGDEGDTLVIAGVTYVRTGAPEDDGTGMTLLRLNRQ